MEAIKCKGCEHVINVEFPKTAGLYKVVCRRCHKENYIKVNVNDSVIMVKCKSCGKQFLAKKPEVAGIYGVDCPVCSREIMIICK